MQEKLRPSPLLEIALLRRVVLPLPNRRPLPHQTTDSVLSKSLPPSRDSRGSRIKALLDFRVTTALGKHQDQTCAEHITGRKRSGE